MVEKTEDKLVKAIESLTDKVITGKITADEALKITQAALNTAHVIQVLRIEKNV